MTDIFPAEGEGVSAVIKRLQGLGFVDGTDFWLHYTWDFKPYVQTTPDTYETWSADVSSNGEGGEDSGPENAGSEAGEQGGGASESANQDAVSSTKDSSGGATASGNNRRQTGKRR